MLRQRTQLLLILFALSAALHFFKLSEPRVVVFDEVHFGSYINDYHDGRLFFTTDKGRAYQNAQVIFICVGTPPDEDGSADLRHVLDVARVIGGETDFKIFGVAAVIKDLKSRGQFAILPNGPYPVKGKA